MQEQRRVCVLLATRSSFVKLTVWAPVHRRADWSSEEAKRPGSGESRALQAPVWKLWSLASRELCDECGTVEHDHGCQISLNALQSCGVLISPPQTMGL